MLIAVPTKEEINYCFVFVVCCLATKIKLKRRGNTHICSIVFFPAFTTVQFCTNVQMANNQNWSQKSLFMIVECGNR